jgi:hypothetical protein
MPIIEDPQGIQQDSTPPGGWAARAGQGSSRPSKIPRLAELPRYRGSGQDLLVFGKDKTVQLVQGWLWAFQSKKNRVLNHGADLRVDGLEVCLGH